MGKKAWVSRFLQQLGEVSAALPDKRAGHHNQQYEMGDAVRGAFSVFFTQSASFLAHQRDMMRRHGQNNLVSIFGARKIPSDNHIRDLLDGVPAEQLAPLYAWLWSALEKAGKLEEYQLLDGRLLVGIDGIRYFSSSKIHCAQCSRSQIGETMHYHHQALTALLVHPQQHEVLPLLPEFITPRMGPRSRTASWPRPSAG